MYKYLAVVPQNRPFLSSDFPKIAIKREKIVDRKVARPMRIQTSEFSEGVFIEFKNDGRENGRRKYEM